MSDIVFDLRVLATPDRTHTPIEVRALADRAADEIEQLRRVVETTRHCISKHLGGCVYGCDEWEAT